MTCLRALYPLVDYVTVNVSSPNTPGLRRLQHGSQLEALLGALIARAPRARRGPAQADPAENRAGPRGGEERAIAEARSPPASTD